MAAQLREPVKKKEEVLLRLKAAHKEELESVILIFHRVVQGMKQIRIHTVGDNMDRDGIGDPCKLGQAGGVGDYLHR